MRPRDEWPASAERLALGEHLLRDLPGGSTIAVASDNDTDGLCAGALALAGLERARHRASRRVTCRGWRGAPRAQVWCSFFHSAYGMP